MLPHPFSDLPESALRRFALPTGGLLFRQGAPSRGPWFVAEGAVRMMRMTEAGHAVCLHRARAGGTLAEASLFSEHYHCDGEAAPGTVAVNLDRAAILARMAQDAGFAGALCARLARQVQAGRRRAELRTIRRAEDRVLAALAEFGTPDGIAGFADEIGLTPEATWRALSALVAQGAVIREARGRYRLTGFDPGQGARGFNGLS